jgi:hypothetical protein
MIPFYINKTFVAENIQPQPYWPTQSSLAFLVFSMPSITQQLDYKVAPEKLLEKTLYYNHGLDCYLHQQGRKSNFCPQLKLIS